MTMGKRGPQRLPTEVLFRRGSNRAGGRPEDKAAPPTTTKKLSRIPKMPSRFLDDDTAKEMWKRLTRMLDGKGTLDRVDEFNVVLYCNEWARYCRHRKALAEYGSDFYIAATTGVHCERPEAKAVARTIDKLMRLSKFFGLDAASRGELDIPQKEEKEDNDKAKYIRGLSSAAL